MIEVLTAEHKIILRIADVLNSISKEANEGLEYNKEDVEAVLQILRLFGDDFHQAKEESALFPVFTTICEKSEYGAVRHMLFEHDQDRSLMEGMEDAVRRSNAAQFAEYAVRLANILRNHIYKEDNILFQTIDRSLSKRDDERIIAEFEAFDREFESHNKPTVMHWLRKLEWKYLGKAA